MFPRFVAAILVVAGSALPQTTTITQLRLRVEPESRTIRPHETAAIQVIVEGTITGSGTTRSGRLQRDGWTARADAGGISKPFKYQGSTDVQFLDTQASGFGQLLGRKLGEYTVKDTFLYTAPAEAGKYTVEVELDQKKAQVEIVVTPEAPTSRTEELRNFPPEQHPPDPYRKLAERYAPFVAQETWFQPKSDYLARFDADGDWRGDNNWDNLDLSTSQAYVYYAAMETATHVFLHYNFFHMRDYSDNCVMGSCHENDNEGMILAIQKDGTEFGRLQMMETLAHNNVYTYINDASLRPGIHDIDGAVPFWKGTQPMVFLEAGGHGALSAGDRRAAFSVETMQFKGTGLTYVYKGTAERPRSGIDREVGYELLPIYDHWWLKSITAEWTEPTFDDYYEYQPLGKRPRMKNARISGAFFGRKHDANKALPFWGWFDTRGRKANATATGQWALDPAYSMSRHVQIPQRQRFSMDYTFNPYLDLQSDGEQASMAAPPNFVAATAVDPNMPIQAASAAVPTTGTESLRAAGASVLGQIMSGRDNSGVRDAMQRAGVGSGGFDALGHILGATKPAGGECTLSVSMAAAGAVVLRGSAVEPAGKLTCAAPLPQTAVVVKLEMKSGPAPAVITEQPSAANRFGATVRIEQPGTYEILVRW